MKLFLGALVIAAMVSLFSGLVFLIKDAGEGDRLIKALWYRVGFSMAVLVLIVVLVYTGHLTLNPQP